MPKRASKKGSPMSSSDAVTSYLDAVSTSFELLAAAGAKATERGTKVSKKFTDQAMASQREALEFAKKLAADPEHLLSSSYATVTESAVTAQTRALAFAQMVYQEALESSTESRDLAEKLAAANKATADAASELSRTFASMNPMTEFMSRGAESAMEAISGKK